MHPLESFALFTRGTSGEDRSEGHSMKLASSPLPSPHLREEKNETGVVVVVTRSCGRAMVIVAVIGHSTFPQFSLGLRQRDGLVRRGKRNRVIRNPWMRFSIDVERPREEFDFVSEKIERHGAGKVSQVFKLDLAERHRLLRSIKNDGLVDIRHGLAEEDNLEVRDLQFLLIDDQDRRAGGLCHKRHGPRASPCPQMLIQREAGGINDHRKQQSDKYWFRQAARSHSGGEGFASGTWMSSCSKRILSIFRVHWDHEPVDRAV